MKLEGKLNRPEIKSIFHKFISNFSGFLLKTDKFSSNYREINIINNINNDIVSSHTIRNYSYLLQKTVLSLLVLFKC